MNVKWRNLLLRLFILVTFCTLTVLSVMSFQYGQPLADANAAIDINYENGHNFINQEIVKNKIREFFTDSNLVDASSLTKLEKYLQAHPHVQKANAFIDSKGKLHVSIDQVHPIARVVPKGGGTFYVDGDRKKIPVSNIYTAKVPVLSGYIPEVCTKVEEINTSELKSLVKIIEETKEDTYWSAQIAQLYMSDSGEIKLIPRLGNHIVTLGDSNDIQGKLKRLEIFYQEISRNIGWNAFENIDVQFNHQIVCK